jgi:divalent metal cation (Fe/Co/Zn/Cd) transporter
MAGSWSQLTDAGVSTGTLHSLAKTLEPLKSTTDKRGICAIRDLRARRAGSLMYVDLTAEVPSGLTVDESSSLENDILETLTKARKEITEVRVRFHPVHTNGTSY